MKVLDAKNTVLPGMKRNTQGSQKAKDQFQEVMNGVMASQVPTSAQTGSPAPGLGPEDILFSQSIQKVGNTEKSAAEAKILREVQDAMSLAGFYSKKLADPRVPPEALEPIVSNLEERMKGLRSVENQGNMDKGLKEIVSELNVTLGTELAKFRRGDYA